MEKIFLELKDKNQPERWTRVIALEKFGKPAVDYLHKALDDDDKWVRYMAADALGNIGHPSAEDALTRTCSRDNCFVKVAAEEALAKVSEAQKHTVIPGKEAAPRASTK